MDMSKVDTLQQFLGYKRTRGLPGVRNHLLILNITGLTEPTARRVHAGLAGSVLASTSYGMGMLGRDRDAQIRALKGLATNPNVGAVVVLSADRPLLDEICRHLKTEERPFTGVCFDDVGHDAFAMTDQALRAGAHLMKEISAQRRELCPMSDLRVGLECGLSDPSSGLAANPVVGLVSDHLVSSGGTVILGETLEWLGVEEDLAKRARSKEVGKAIVEAVADLEAFATASNVDLLGTNPNAANIRGGLSTIEEKAFGAVAKSGQSQIQSVLDFAECPVRPGLHVMNAASYSPESLTGFVAAGAQVVLFTTGLGNSYVSILAPTLKLSANAKTVRHLSEQIDFNASAALSGTDQGAVAEALVEDLLDVASGTRTFGEILSEGSESISRYGMSL